MTFTNPDPTPPAGCSATGDCHEDTPKGGYDPSNPLGLVPGSELDTCIRTTPQYVGYCMSAGYSPTKPAGDPNYGPVLWATGVFITVTGDINVIDRQHMEAMKDGAIVANSGHFDVEINTKALAQIAEGRRVIRPFVEEFRLADGKRIFLLGDGRLINLAAAEGHPASVMDMSFANQALCAEYLVLQEKPLPLGVHVVPEAIDKEIARLKLASMGITIDTLTPEQETYLASWESGT